MSAGDTKEAVEKALAALDAAGVDVESLRVRLEDESIFGVIVGPWPPEPASKSDVNALVKTRSLVLESLDLLAANSADSEIAKPLADCVAQASEALDKAGVGGGRDDLGTGHPRSIVGRWPRI